MMELLQLFADETHAGTKTYHIPQNYSGMWAGQTDNPTSGGAEVLQTGQVASMRFWEPLVTSGK